MSEELKECPGISGYIGKNPAVVEFSGANLIVHLLEDADVCDWYDNVILKFDLPECFNPRTDKRAFESHQRTVEIF